MLKVLIEHIDFPDVIKEATIPFEEGSQKIRIADKPVSFLANGDPDETVKVLQFEYADKNDFILTQDFTLDEVSDYLELLRRFINQMNK